jgi:hypothetical protein
MAAAAKVFGAAFSAAAATLLHLYILLFTLASALGLRIGLAAACGIVVSHNIAFIGDSIDE